MPEINDTIRDIILDNVANLENAQITLETNLIRDIGLDSISLMMLVILIEDKFDIELPDDFLTEENLSIYGNVVSMVEMLLSR